MERAIQEAQEETDEQGKVKEQVGTGALGAQARTRRIVVKKRMLVFYRMSKAPRGRGRCRNFKTQKENIQ